MPIQQNISSASSLLWFGNTLVSIPVSFGDGIDQMYVIENWASFGDGPPRHIHHTPDEAFVVLKGLVHIALGRKEIVLGQGQRALAPKDAPHTYRVESVEGAQFRCVTKGADSKTMVRKASHPAATATLPQAVATSPAVVAGLRALCAEARFDLVGPSLM